MKLVLQHQKKALRQNQVVFEKEASVFLIKIRHTIPSKPLNQKNLHQQSS